MSPVLVTPPTAPLVPIYDMKAHLRVDGYEEDTLIEAMTAGAVAYLDGYKGILGRAIMPQTWRETFTGSGLYRLSMPDVTTAVITADGEPVTGAVIGFDALGPWVALPEGAAPTATVIDYTCGLPPQQLPAVRMAVMLLVGHWFANRESVATGTIATEIPLGFDMLVSSMRWRSV